MTLLIILLTTTLLVSAVMMAMKNDHNKDDVDSLKKYLTGRDGDQKQAA